ncbi:WAS/WASL-interacting protein family member 2 [Dissostichus eleginoides]|uniref:WAS/WASL-interacting protein family member 2 n=1 Tax=Dissostichus eleginoides TaxID=100907 RepID=A0AAD9BR29_DISEL|nr:WAS/WASL-interacting protein family member 2 [Dissostichus eleginoides]
MSAAASMALPAGQECGVLPILIQKLFDEGVKQRIENANINPSKLGSNEKGRGALLSDIHKGARLKKVSGVNDRSSPIIENGSSGGSVGRSALRPPGSRPAAPRPPSGRSSSPSPRPPSGRSSSPSPRPPTGRSSSPSPRPPTGRSSSPSMANKPAPPENQHSHRPSLPDISRPSSAGGMKHSTSAPPPPPPFNRGGARNNAPPTPNQKSYAPTSSSNNNHSREKPLPPTPNRGHTSPNSVKPPPSSSRPPTAPQVPPNGSRNGSHDFESKFNFHPIEDLPPPEEYRNFSKVYPSKNNKGMMRGAPPAPPVGRTENHSELRGFISYQDRNSKHFHPFQQCQPMLLETLHEAYLCTYDNRKNPGIRIHVDVTKIQRHYEGKSVEKLWSESIILPFAAGGPFGGKDDDNKPVEAVEGRSVTLQCRLDPPIDLSSKTVEWNRGPNRYVHVYRSQRDDPDSQMLQYRDRTALNHGDLTRGVSTLTISNVSLSDNGSYEVYLPKLEVTCLTHLTVVTKDQENQTKRNDSSTTAPPAGERNDASNREAGRAAIILTVFLVLSVLVVLLVLKSGKTPVEAVEGRSVTLQCRLDPPIDLSSKTVDWNRGLTHQVHVYRSQRDDPELQMPQYRDRTALNHGDLTRGVLTLTISNVSLSDNGSYEVYLPKLEVTCLTHLTVVKEEEQTKRKDSGTPAAPAEGDPDVWKIVLPCVLIPAAAAVVVIVVWKRRVIPLPLACLPSQPVEAVEGRSVTLQCRLDPPIDLSSKTVEWNRGPNRYVHVYRSQRDDPDSQMLQYRDRTALNHGDLTRGVLTLTISNVSLSDNGSYEVYLPKLEVTCLTHLTVVTKDQENQTKRNDSSTTAPPAGERNDASNREAGRAAIILTVFLVLSVLVVFCWF